MLIQLLPTKLELQPLMVGMFLVLRPPISTDQKVLSHKISPDGHTIHCFLPEQAQGVFGASFPGEVLRSSASPGKNCSKNTAG
jgi:hypothetical protein